MPTIVSDSFTEASDVNLETHVPDTGTGWSIGENTSGISLQVFASFDVARIPATVASSRIIYLSAPDPSATEYDVEFTIPTNTVMPTGTDDPCFLVGRWIDANNYYSAGTYQTATGGAVRIFKKVGGVVTQLASGTNAIAVGDTLTFKVRDASKSLWINGVQALSTTDNALSAAGRAGFGTGNAWVATDDVQGGWRWDDYTVFDFPTSDIGEAPMVASGAGVGSAQSSAWTPIAGSLLVAVGASERNDSTNPGQPAITSAGTTLTWTPITSRVVDLNARRIYMRTWVAVVPATVSATTVTSTSSGAQASLIAVLQMLGMTSQVTNFVSAEATAPNPSDNLPNAPDDTSTTIVFDAYSLAADLGVTANFTQVADLTTTQGSVTFGLAAAWTTEKTTTGVGYSAATGFTSDSGVMIAIEVPRAPTSTAGAGTSEILVRPLMGANGTKLGGGYSDLVVTPSIEPGGIADFNDVDIFVPVQIGGFGGRFFVPVAGPVGLLPHFRGEADQVNYQVAITMAPGSVWLVTQDVRAVTIDRALAIWPGAVEAGTCDVTLDDASGYYSPLKTAVHGGTFRPNMPIAITAQHAPLIDNIIRSYSLFNGLIDAITVDPALDESTVTLRCRDAWKLLQERLVSTSMLVDYNAGSALTVALTQASIGFSQHSIDAVSEILPFTSYLRRPLADVIGDFIEGGGYAAYVAADGVIRVRNKYFDLGGAGVASYHQDKGFSYSFDDSDVYNKLETRAKVRYHVPSRQVVGRLQQMVIVPASTDLSFTLDFFDPRNNQAAGARNGQQPQTSSLDWFLNTNSAGGGTNLSATGSVRVTYWGDGARVSVFNGAGNAGFLTKLELRAEPVLLADDVAVGVEVNSSIVNYGVRDAQIESALFTQQGQLEIRASDVLEQFAGPQAKLSLTAIDDFPGCFLTDLGKIVLVTNEHTGLDQGQFVVYGLTHEIRADDVGVVHQMTLSLREARQFDVFILDTDHLDSGRLAK